MSDDNIIKKLDECTIEELAHFIGGDVNGETKDYPLYRSSRLLTKFFKRVGLNNLIHDGSSRIPWVFEKLSELHYSDLNNIILRLANPKEYGGDSEKVKKAINKLNQILKVEGFEVVLVNNVNPQIRGIEPSIQARNEDYLNQILFEQPEFNKFSLDPTNEKNFFERYHEIQRCINSKCYLSAIILMGSLLEGLILEVMKKFPEEANQSKHTPKEKSGKAKIFRDWTFASMINVAHDLDWIDLEIKSFSNPLREFRNLVHISEQKRMNVFPDEGTCKIIGQVLNEAIKDLSKKLITEG